MKQSYGNPATQCLLKEIEKEEDYINIESLLKENEYVLPENPNATNEAGDSALILSILYQKEDQVKFLLDCGADPNFPDTKNISPLIHAVKTGNQNIVELILIKKPILQVVDEDGNTPLAITIIKKYDGILELLINYGAEVSEITKNGDSLVGIATALANSKALEILLESNAPPAIPMKDGNTPLILAIAEKKLDIAANLLEKMTINDINTKNNNGDTALSVAVKDNFSLGAELLLKFSADPDTKNLMGESSLLLAYKYKQLEIIELLLDNKDLTNNNGLELLTMALKDRSNDVVSLLLKHDISPFTGDKSGKTPFMIVPLYQKLEIIYSCVLKHVTDLPKLIRYESSHTYLADEKQERTDTIKKIYSDSLSFIKGAAVGNLVFLPLIEYSKDYITNKTDNKNLTEYYIDHYKTLLDLTSIIGHLSVPMATLLLKSYCAINLQAPENNYLSYIAPKFTDSSFYQGLITSVASPAISFIGETAYSLLNEQFDSSKHNDTEF